ncbi:hypothetical protein E3N88_31300 [Mikania micrantha]|uniref:C3H1-type domain-containing protein n=1 Tax=Mikania micrantha TaxID=192012 RepID=A0A5N6MPX6_9ASTR|nr:hypothetical protein E3N88_31300 [Mikania micrantha]
MVGRKLFKTRICLLYRKGRCHRQSCSFAHGDAELRRYNGSSSYNARRDYHGADLRDKLERQWSPPRRNTLERDARDPLPSPRFGKKSDWGHRKRHHFDGENDYSGNLRLADGVERQARDKKPSTSDFNDIHDEQLKQLHSEIDILEDHKQQLQIYIEESAQEADSLKSKVEELEMQLSTEKDECKRISSKIRKFVRANNRHVRILEELKRQGYVPVLSQARLQRLGDQLGSDVRAIANDDDINTGILSDEETMENLSMSPKIHKASPRRNEISGNHLIVPRREQFKASPSKKRMRVDMSEADERSKQGHVAGDRANFGDLRSERHSRWDPNFAELKNTSELRAESNGISNTRPSVNDDKQIRRKSNFNNSPSRNKYKDLKSTGIAANAVDEVVEVVELNEKLEAQENLSTRVEGGSTHVNTSLPPPPPPPIASNVYLQIPIKCFNLKSKVKMQFFVRDPVQSERLTNGGQTPAAAIPAETAAYKEKNERVDAVNDEDNDDVEVDDDEMLDVDIV